MLRPVARWTSQRAASSIWTGAASPSIGASSAAVTQREGVAASAIPGDLVTASGSGIDPHISPDAARLQVARVAQARGLSAAQVQQLVAAGTLGATFGVLGQARVNVLELNLALDAVAGQRP